MARSQKIDRRQAIKLSAAAASVAATTISGKSAKADKPFKNLVQLGHRTKTNLTPLKLRAASDYRTSLKPYGGQFSNPIRDLFTTAKKEDKIHFGVVVVGSGYKPLGLFNLMINNEVNVLTGSGLGGGSLVNASIALRPHADVFRQQRWPEALRHVEVLGPYYDAMARSMSLSRTPFDQTPKVRSRRLAAERIECFCDVRPPIFGSKHAESARHDPASVYFVW